MKTKHFMLAILALTVLTVSSCTKESADNGIYEIKSLNKKEVQNGDV